MTSASGAEVKDYDYQAFGSLQSQSGTMVNERTFTGHISDAEVNLIYMGARYYDAALGRFISADAIVASFANPQSLNRYSYVSNNPINNTDPTGHKEDNCPYGVIGGQCAQAPSTTPNKGNTRTNNGSGTTTSNATSTNQTSGAGDKGSGSPEICPNPNLLVTLGTVNPGDIDPLFLYNGYPMLFGQARVHPTFGFGKLVPRSLKGADFRQIADALKTGEASPEVVQDVQSMETSFFWDENSQAWVAINSRGFSMFVRAGMRPSNIVINNNPAREVVNRLNEISRLGDELPSTRIAVTEGRTGPIIDTIEIPGARIIEAPGEDPVIVNPVEGVPEILNPLLGLPGPGAGSVVDDMPDEPIPFDLP